MPTDYETQETPRGGTFHLYHKPRRGKPIPQKEIPFTDGDTFALVAEKGVDPERLQAEERQRIETATARIEFEKAAQLTLV